MCLRVRQGSLAFICDLGLVTTVTISLSLLSKAKAYFCAIFQANPKKAPGPIRVGCPLGPQDMDGQRSIKKVDFGPFFKTIGFFPILPE